MGPILKPSEAADYIGTTVGTLGNWRSAGKGPAYIKQDRFIRYSRAELDRWLSAQQRQPEPKDVHGDELVEEAV